MTNENDSSGGEIEEKALVGQTDTSNDCADENEEEPDEDYEWAQELLEQGRALREEWKRLLRSLTMRGGRYRAIADRSKAYAFAYLSQAIDDENDFVGDMAGNLQEIVNDLSPDGGDENE